MAGRKQKFAKEAQALAVMAKAGRKAEVGLREPSGRLSRSARKLLGADSVNEIYRVRAAALSGAGDKRWATQLGRLFLEGKISGEQYGAGQSWDRLMEQWRKIHCGPRFNPKAGLANLQRISGSGPSVGADVADEQEEAIRDLVDKAIGSFSRGAGDPLLVAVRECVELDLAPVGVGGWMLLDEGLAHLVAHWRVEA